MVGMNQNAKYIAIAICAQNYVRTILIGPQMYLAICDQVQCNGFELTIAATGANRHRLIIAYYA